MELVVVAGVVGTGAATGGGITVVVGVVAVSLMIVFKTTVVKVSSL